MSMCLRNPIQDGIILPDDRTAAKTNGEAYVVFVDQETADRALMRHMKNMQHRYVLWFSAFRVRVTSTCRQSPTSFFHVLTDSGYPR